MRTVVLGVVLLAGLGAVAEAQDKPTPLNAEDLRTIIEHQRMNTSMVLQYGGMTLAKLPSMEEIRDKAQAGYRKAKNQQETDSVKSYCRDLVAAHSFKARDSLNVQAFKLLEAGQVDPANLALKKSIALSDLDQNLADLSCRPST